MKIYKNEMKIQQQQKPPRRFFQAKYHRWELLTFRFKKMITEVLLILLLYLILFFIQYLFRRLIKIMGDIENLLTNDKFFGDIVDTPKEGIEQHKKRECLKSVIDQGKTHLLGHKWTHERVDKSIDETINKKYAKYKQREINEKGEKTGEALIIKDQMANLGCLFV